MARAPRKPGVTRRRFLLLATGVVGFVGLGLFRFRRRLYSSLLGVELDPTAGLRSLEDAEIETLVALGDVLFPAAYAQGAVHGAQGREVTVSLVKERSENTPGVWVEYRNGAALLDRWARAGGGTTFAGMPLADRSRMVTEMLARPAAASRRDRLLLFLERDGRGRWLLWHHVAQPLLIEFYRSAGGWETIGYAVMPGECQDLEYYQHAPGQA